MPLKHSLLVSAQHSKNYHFLTKPQITKDLNAG